MRSLWLTWLALLAGCMFAGAYPQKIDAPRFVIEGDCICEQDGAVSPSQLR